MPLSTVRSIFASDRPTRLTQNLSEHFRIARHVFLVAAPVGAIVGVAIAGYDYIVNVLLWERFTHRFSPLTLCFFPIIGMFVTGLILSVFKVKSSAMADEVVLAYHRPEKGIDYASAIPKFTASVATMGFGGSAGMEGASKWVGATIASFLQWHINRVKRLNWFHGRVETTMLAGAAAGISAIFRAPLTGAIMGIESPYKHDLAHESLIHGLVAASTSYATFICFRPATPYFPISFTYHLHARDLLLCIPGYPGWITLTRFSRNSWPDQDHLEALEYSCATQISGWRAADCGNRPHRESCDRSAGNTASWIANRQRTLERQVCAWGLHFHPVCKTDCQRIDFRHGRCRRLVRALCDHRRGHGRSLRSRAPPQSAWTVHAGRDRSVHWCEL